MLSSSAPVPRTGSWGLDANHDEGPSVPDVRIEQAMVNLFADMYVQPATLVAGLVPATASTDTIAPVSSVISPTAGSIVQGSPITITGTAADSGGGIVAGVEVGFSTDGGTTWTWHPATGGANWSYSWFPTSLGNTLIESRATDDSGNLGAPSPAVPVMVKELSGSVSIWPDSVTPQGFASNDSQPVSVGVKFTSDVAGSIAGIRFYKDATNTGTHIGQLYTASGTLLGSATFTNETNSGWQEITFATPVQINPNTTYVASYFTDSGQYAQDINYFTSSFNDAPLHATVGVYTYGSAATFPSHSYALSNYWVDVLFTATPTQPLSVTSVTPADGGNEDEANSIATSTSSVTATFNELLDPTTVTTATFLLTDANGNAVPATVSYNAATDTVTLTPSSPLAALTYTATLKGNANGPGIAALSEAPLLADFSWTFSVAAGTSLWTALTVPTTPDSGDGSAVEVGVKFTADIPGLITGISFYKGAGNTGTHIGTLWTANGIALAQATFTNESATGWETVIFATPVPINAGTTYVASYHTDAGHYSINRGYFSQTYNSGVLHAQSGGNGVYVYGAHAFPTNSYNNTNYWVDVLFTASPNAPPTPPTVITVTPAGGGTERVSSVTTTSSVSATFSEPLDPTTVTTTTFLLMDANGNAVPASVAYNAVTDTVTLTPTSPLATATYTATLKGNANGPGIASLSGAPLAADYTWTFSTVAAASLWSALTVPTTTDSGDGSAVEVGVKFTADIPGVITGISFYKGVGNTGTHIGTLWTANGTVLAQATFTNESATGWETVSFATPVPISAGTTYVASYYTPTGHYSIDRGYFSQTYNNGDLHAQSGGNGVYVYGGHAFPINSYNNSNYWVDVLFTASPNAAADAADGDNRDADGRDDGAGGERVGDVQRVLIRRR